MPDKDDKLTIKKRSVVVTKKELELRSRGATFPILITILNSILFVVCISLIFSVISGMRQTQLPNYRVFLYIFAGMALVSFTIILLISPLFSGASIAGEREGNTFDLLLTTSLTPFDIVMEKMLSEFLSLAVVMLSMMPGICLSLIFGGVNFLDIFILYLSFLPGIFLMLSVGIFSSSLTFKTNQGIALSYGICMAFIAGPFVIGLITRNFVSSGRNYASYLIMLDPLYTVIGVLGRGTGESDILNRLMNFLNLIPEQIFFDFSIIISVIIEILLGFSFLLMSVINIMPEGFMSGKRSFREGGSKI